VWNLSDITEKLIIKGLLTDKKYLTAVSSIFEPDYFDEPVAKEIFTKIKDYHDTYLKSVDSGVLLTMDYKNIDEARTYLESVNQLDYDVAKHYDHLFNNTNKFLKEAAMRNAIMSSIPLMKNDQMAEIEDLVKHALSKDLRIDLGLEYFESIAERLHRMIEGTGRRISFGYPTLDEMTNGGTHAFSLSVFLAQIHGFKSTLMTNIASRQIMKGYNVVLFTLEMCEDEFGKRFDGGFTGYDINKIYIKDTDPHKGFLRTLVELKQNPNRGKLFIKQFPTGEATRNDLRRYLRELLIRDIKADVIYVDYINLMKPAIKTEGLYGAVKQIAHELRSLSFEFEAPVVSVSQLNREGALMHFNDVNFNFTSESMGLPAACDFMGILGQPEDEFTYTQEVHCKISKNRLGGRIGERFPFYYDSRSLRMYDQHELERWMDDARLTNDEREVQSTNED
jgi:replicative DNA helicase